MSDLPSRIVEVIKDYLDQLPANVKSGVVEAVDPLKVKFPQDAAAVTVRRAASTYTPQVGDLVVVRRIGPLTRPNQGSWIAEYAVEVDEGGTA